MNFLVKYFFVLAILALSPVAVFAQDQTPKQGDVIKISINGYDIQAKVISVTAPQSTTTTQPASTTPETITQSQTITTQTPTTDQSTNNSSLIPADIQQGLDNFTNSNPIKSGIEALDNAIIAQAGKWLHLDLGNNQNAKVADTKSPSDISTWTASALNAVTPFFKDIKNYWYLGVALIFLVVLFLLWKGKSKYDREY